MRKTTFITELVWRSLNKEIRKAILIKTGLRRNEIVNTMFASSLESRLREHGEHELANMLYHECEREFEFEFFTINEEVIICVQGDDVHLQDIDWDDVLLSTQRDWLAGLYTFTFTLDYSTSTCTVVAKPKKEN